MSAIVRVKAVVQPGGKLEVTVPELEARAGETVEVDVAVSTPVPVEPPKLGIYDLILSLPPSTKTPEEWEQFEREFQEMRDEWDR